jgi:hypothetical protein
MGESNCLMIFLPVITHDYQLGGDVVSTPLPESFPNPERAIRISPLEFQPPLALLGHG